MKAGELSVRSALDADRSELRRFRCSTGPSWEHRVEAEIRGPLTNRYLSSPPVFDGRLLLGFNTEDALIVVGAHRIEPTFVQDVGYTEVIAVALDARGTVVTLPDGADLSLGHFMFLTIFRQMVRLGRHKRTFARVDRRNTRSLALLDRVGLSEELNDPHDAQLVQRWGELP